MSMMFLVVLIRDAQAAQRRRCRIPKYCLNEQTCVETTHHIPSAIQQFVFNAGAIVCCRKRIFEKARWDEGTLLEKSMIFAFKNIFVVAEEVGDAASATMKDGKSNRTVVHHAQRVDQANVFGRCARFHLIGFRHFQDFHNEVFLAFECFMQINEIKNILRRTQKENYIENGKTFFRNVWKIWKLVCSFSCLRVPFSQKGTHRVIRQSAEHCDKNVSHFEKKSFCHSLCCRNCQLAV